MVSAVLPEDGLAESCRRVKQIGLSQICFIIQGVPLATEPGNEDIATKFEQEYVHCVRNEEECVCSVCL